MRTLETYNGVSQGIDEPGFLENEDDAAIVRAVVGGNKDRFRLLVLRHQDFVFALIMRQIADRATAEEIVQEAFMKAYRNLHLFRFEAKFSTWLTRIALNTMNSYYSSRAYKEKKRTDSFSPVHHDTASNISADSGSDLDQFRNLLATLNPKLRDVLVLCSLEGRSYEEAASLLSIPIGTVRSRLNKARLVLKEAFLAAAGADAEAALPSGGKT